MLTDFNQFVPQQVCLSCDGCCRFKDADSSWRPKAAPEEIDAARAAGLAEHIFSRADLDGEQRITIGGCHNGSHICRFFSPQDNRCTIYAYRPFECQLYPFVLMKDAGRLVVAVHTLCPHIESSGTSAGFADYTEYLRTFFRRDDVARFIRSNAAMVDDYAEYRDELRPLFAVNGEDV